MKTTLISIILPTYNGSSFIAEAVESVLLQTYSNWELLVISDGSTDNTKEVITKYSHNDTRIVYIENESNLGIQKTLNKGIGLAKGEYIARLDDDDRWINSSKLQEQVSFFESNQDYVLVGTDALVMDTKGREVSINIMPKSDNDIRSKMLSKNCFLHATVLYRKSTVEKVGGYSENIKKLHAEDYDLWLKLGNEGKMKNLTIRSTSLTAHENSLTTRNRSLQAKNILSLTVEYKKQYPHFLYGYCVSLLRYVFFTLFTYIPLPKGLIYGIQRIYRAI